MPTDANKMVTVQISVEDVARLASELEYASNCYFEATLLFIVTGDQVALAETKSQQEFCHKWAKIFTLITREAKGE